MATPKIPAELLQLIQTEARKQAEAVYAEKGTMFNVADVPTHTHNNIDSVSIPSTSVDGFYPLSSAPNILGSEGGILAPANLGNQIVTQGSHLRGYGRFQSVGNSSFTTFPLVIINGNGVGVDSQFNGGNAPEGTMIFFNNGSTISGLWVRSGGQWYGVGQGTIGYSNRVI